MLRGLYTVTTGMIHQRKKLDTIANNLANSNTRGYKKDSLVSHSFKDELLLRVDNRNGTSRRIGPINHGVYAQQVATLFEEGALRHTGEITDIALQGDGFFTIVTEEGPVYTRDGTFKVNDEGILTTISGQVVSGQNGPILVGHEEFEIDEQGDVFIHGDVHVDRLDLTSFADLSLLEKVGDNLFANNSGDNPVQVFQGQVIQGYAESSNVEPLEEMTDMIVVSRSYEASQRALQMIDETLAKTVNEVGSV